MTDTRISDAISYPATTPAALDRVPGTDISDIATHADGKTVSFTMQAMADLMTTLAPPWRFVEQLSGTTSPMTSSAFEDGFEYRCVGFDVAPASGSNRYIHYDLQKDSDSSWISGVDTTSNLAGMITDNVLTTNPVQFDLEIVDPRISRVNHHVRFLGSTVLGATVASLSDAMATNSSAGSLVANQRMLSFSSADKVSAIRFQSSSGAFSSGGSINIYKRPIAHS